MVYELILTFLILSNLLLYFCILDIGFVVMLFVWVETSFLEAIEESYFFPFFKGDLTLFLFLTELYLMHLLLK